MIGCLAGRTGHEGERTDLPSWDGGGDSATHQEENDAGDRDPF